MRKLVLASRNRGKIAELEAMLAESSFIVAGLEDYPDAPEVEETGATFTDNAVLKARTIGDYTGELTLADDSGLEVDYLKGEPGVYSARYGEPGWTDRQRYEYLLTKLAGVPEELRSARFRSVVALYDPDTKALRLTEGSVEGTIGFEPRGGNGFGYDPIFFLPDYQQTMAEVPATIKNRLSHRARAMQKIIPKLREFLK